MSLEWTDPEVEQIATDQRPSADAVFSLEAEQCHTLSPRFYAGVRRSSDRYRHRAVVFKIG